MEFIGRKVELDRLIDLCKKKSASLVVIRGRRRIGKSRLVEEFGSKYRFISLSGLPPAVHSTADSQRKEFIKQLARKYGVPEVRSDDWGDLFWMLASVTHVGRVVILLDEISWMGARNSIS